MGGCRLRSNEDSDGPYLGVLRAVLVSGSSGAVALRPLAVVSWSVGNLFRGPACCRARLIGS
jgi:hypothetical protein